METWITVLLTFLTGVGASSGFWAWLQSKDGRKSATLTLLLGLAHDRIISSGMQYVERGSITKDEYQDFVKYLYEPYSKFGGNGLADRVMEEVKRLPIKGHVNPIAQVIKEKHEGHVY